MWFFKLIGGLMIFALFLSLLGGLFGIGYLAWATATGVAPAAVGPAYGVGWGFGWGFGGFFHLLGTIFLVAIFIGMLRAIFGGGRRHGRRAWDEGWNGGPWGHDAGPGRHRWSFGPSADEARAMHDEWHRRESAATNPATDSGGSSGASGSVPGDGPAGGVQS